MSEQKSKIRFEDIITSRWALLIGTVLALIPQYIIRSDFKIFFYIHRLLGTYQGDLWYCWSNYLDKGFPYPREYPAGIQMIYRLIFKLKPPHWKYEDYIIWIAIFLAIFAVIITNILYEIVQRSHKDKRKIWMFWILTPSFLFYGLLNLDFLSIFAMMLGYYFFIEEEYELCAGMIALGATFKVFPVFLLPLLFFECPTKKRIRLVLVFVGCWLLYNIPYMIADWNAWRYPYYWQVTENFAKSPQDGTYFWIVYYILSSTQTWVEKHISHAGFLWNVHSALAPYKHHIGKISLLLYGVLYYWFLRRRWDLDLPRRCVGIILLFLLTDRIYSPQYNLYLLPFLVISVFNFKDKRERICFLIAFYVAEMLNFFQVLFLFKIRQMEWIIPGVPFLSNHPFPYLFQSIVIFKLLALIVLFWMNWRIDDGCQKQGEKGRMPDTAVGNMKNG